MKRLIVSSYDIESILDESVSSNDPITYLESKAPWIVSSPVSTDIILSDSDNLSKNQILDIVSDAVYSGNSGDVLEVRTSGRSAHTLIYIRIDKYTWTSEGEVYNYIQKRTGGRLNKYSENELLRELRYFINNGSIDYVYLKHY